MVGLSIVLETQKGASNNRIRIGHCYTDTTTNTVLGSSSSSNPQVINKTNMILHKLHPSNSIKTTAFSSQASSSSSSFCLPAFLQQCFLCQQKLLPGKDIYMYKGDKAFCSEECRCRQIFMDEEETLRKQNCSLAAKSTTRATTTSNPSSSRRYKSTRNRNGGGLDFAY